MWFNSRFNMIMKAGDKNQKVKRFCVCITSWIASIIPESEQSLFLSLWHYSMCGSGVNSVVFFAREKVQKKFAPLSFDLPLSLSQILFGSFKFLSLQFAVHSWRQQVVSFSLFKTCFMVVPLYLCFFVFVFIPSFILTKAHPLLLTDMTYGCLLCPQLLSYLICWNYIYIYIYRERERERNFWCISLKCS